mgnify:CR=1 FL=1
MIKKDLGSPDISYIGHLLAGVDEAGRGPLAGDVVAAAVILDPLRPIAGLADSKKLTEKKREVFSQILATYAWTPPQPSPHRTLY